MKIFLVGAGALALDIEQYILDCNAARRGFFDAQGNPVETATLSGIYFEGSGRMQDFRSNPIRIDDLQEISEGASEQCSDAHWMIAIGESEARRKYWRILSERGARFATLVHPTCLVSERARIGAGTILCPMAIACNFSVIGENVVLNGYASVGHDAKIGAHSILSPYACLNGFAEVGETCFLGSHANITPKKRVGAFSKISAGTIVYKDADPGSMIFGNPAKARRMFAVPD